MNTTFADALRHVFAASLSDAKFMKAEGPLTLAYGVLPTGATFGQLKALALAIREIAALETTTPEKPLSKKQHDAWQALAAEKALPAAFRELLVAAQPRVTTRIDLERLYGLLAATQEKLMTLSSVSNLVMQEAVKPLKADRHPRGKMRG